MIIFGLVEIKLLTKKSKVLETYTKHGIMHAIKKHKELYNSSLKEANLTVKKWTGRA